MFNGHPFRKRQSHERAACEVVMNEHA